MCRAVEGPSDQLLVCPPQEWLRKFGRICVLRVSRPDPEAASVEAGDCDDVADDVVGFARRCRNQNRDYVRKGYGFAVGKCRVFIQLDQTLNGIEGNGLDQHYTNIIRTTEEWVFFEGQTGLWCPCRDALSRGVCDLLFVGM